MTDIKPKPRSRFCVYAALLLITAVAAGFRFYTIARLPPGLHYDEAFNNLLAMRVVRDGKWPIFFIENFGQEPLHIYLIALLFHLTGPTVLGGRLVSAFVGTAAVPLLFWAVREMFHQEAGERRATELGLAAALSLGVLYWHAHYSRIGMMPITAPTMTVAALGAVWSALRQRRLLVAAGGGALLGATLYTYSAARLVPVLLAFFFGIWILAQRGFLRTHWRTLVIVASVAALVFAPLGYFFATHPFWFALRASQVTSDDLMASFGKVVKGLILRGQGDLNHRQNLPGRPALDLAQAVLFVLGVGTCVARCRSPYLFLLCWLGMMLLPSALTEYPPHFGRMLGAAPPTATLVGLGAITLYDLISAATTRWLPQARQVALAGTVLLLTLTFALSGARAARDYFLIWGRSGDLFIAFDVGLRQIGEYVAALLPEQRVYISPVPNSYATLAFLLDDEPHRMHSYNGRRCVVYPAITETPTTHVIVVLEESNSLPTLQAAFPDGQVVEEVYMGDTLYSVAYRTPTGSTAQIGPIHRLEADFDGKIRLLGYDRPAGPFVPGDTISLRLYWQSQASMTERYKVFVHLWGAPSPSEAESIWGQEDVHPCDNSYYTPWWAVGEVVADEYRIPISPDTPSGEYQLLVGFYQENGPRLPVLDAVGEPTGDYVAVTTVQVVAR